MAFEIPENEKLSPWWRYSVIIVMVIGFAILGFVTHLAYDNVPPIPQKVVTSAGKVLFTSDDILKGQEIFLKNNLMEHGTLWGHGAYLGPDYSAEYLHQEALSIQESLSKSKFSKPFSALDPMQQGGIIETIHQILKHNRYDEKSGILTFTDEEALAYQEAIDYWSKYFTSGEAPGLPTDYIKDPKDRKDLTTFFAWAAWAAAANRHGEDFSYTNNFPYDPLAGNYPSTDAYFWSAMSLITLLGGIGLVMFLFGKFDYLGWKSPDRLKYLHEAHTKEPTLTPSQKATGKFFAIVVLLFLAQSLVGGLVAHYRVDSSLYGLPIIDWFPYNLLRTWHLQLAIFWIATAWIGGALFIAPLINNTEPKFQKLGINLLFGALVFVAVGSLFGEFLSSKHLLPGELWFWIGNQGSEYLDLGRFWQILLIAGFAFWLCLLFRALKSSMTTPGKRELSIIFFCAAATIPIFYTPALFYDHQTNYSLIDNWRFWIIHLWVEGFFEVFSTVLVAVIFANMGITKTVVALRVIYLDAILYLGSGVVGTGHHWYFTGQTNINMALSACFSAMEVLPLTLLTRDAWDFIKVSQTRCDQCGHYVTSRQRWTIYFFMAVGVWNFIGAGILGFLINLPIISYFEVGTNLTPNHGHAAMFGVFGMLALGVVMFCTRSQQSEALWNKTKNLVKIGFFGLNGGMALMVLIDLFPSGVLQLWDAMSEGYWHARQLSFLMSGTFHTLEWIRIIGDTIFIVFGVIPITSAVLMTYFAKKEPQIA